MMLVSSAVKDTITCILVHEYSNTRGGGIGYDRTSDQVDLGEIEKIQI